VTGADDILAAAERLRAAGPSSPRLARDPVNLPAVRNWTDAMGDTNPVYTDAHFAARSVHGQLVAPPAMVQVWTMPGLVHPAGGGDIDPLGQMMTVLDEAGFTAVVATNCAQSYHRYLRHGELLSLRTELADVSGPKHTALGDGWFVTTRNIWYSGAEPVAEMDWRVLRFRPRRAGHAAADGAARGDYPPNPPQGEQAPNGAVVAAGAGAATAAGAGASLRPPMSPDTEFFWAGTQIGELRLQRCSSCGALRHPPGPACPSCGGIGKPEYQVAAGTGTVFSYVVHRHPPVPGKRLPIVVALVELTEGPRVMAELTGADVAEVGIGMPVRVGFVRIDDDLVLPVWRPADPSILPDWTLHVTPTVVVATALATRDFYPVHHDRDFAARSGSKDIFLNILTTTGLVQRYVTDWAGPEAMVRGVAIRLGAPCYAGDTLTFSGQVSATSADEREIAVTGRCSLGDHVTGTVRLAPPVAQQ
jgi:uncharacterized OB-fold protein/acyl dehydratase